MAAFANFKIENDRNTLSFEQKFNMHISEIAKSSGKGGRRAKRARRTERATHEGSSKKSWSVLGFCVEASASIAQLVRA